MNIPRQLQTSWHPPRLLQWQEWPAACHPGFRFNAQSAFEKIIMQKSLKTSRCHDPRTTRCSWPVKLQQHTWHLRASWQESRWRRQRCSQPAQLRTVHISHIFGNGMDISVLLSSSSSRNVSPRNLGLPNRNNTRPAICEKLEPSTTKCAWV